MANNVKITGIELKGLKDHLKNLLGDKNPGVKVGVLDGATYSEGPAAGEYVAQILAHHEFGAPSRNIPPRMPFRSTIAKKKADWSKEAAAYLKASSEHIDVKAALTQVGDVMAMDIQQAFEDGLEPELKATTIKQKMRITREGGRTEKKKSGKEKGQYKTGDYAANASTPVMLTGTAQRSIKSEYMDDLTSVGAE